MFRDFLCKIKAGLVCNSLQLLYAFECFQSNNRALSVLAFSLLCMLRAYFIFAERIFYIEDTLLVPQGRITLKKEHRKSNALFWSEWRDLNSRPLDPQSSALPTAPHPVVPKLNLLSAYRLFANRRGASFRNIVAVLRLERSFCSLFLHLGAMPSSATGGGISSRPAAPHPESSSIIPQEKRFDKSFSKLF